ncbi:uncharacterized protein LOC131947080 [Physella acuta]|uniref:uncharacterized protein LOC131947080 n=1 Tax=Physella acuta TaxID=109671 RepID=UPI0027DAEA4F|nr:uncharacterized protein LOC131947080 [Physella acuta]
MDESGFVLTPTHTITADHNSPDVLDYHTPPAAPSHVSRGRKVFVNSRSFSTLTTQLSSVADHTALSSSLDNSLRVRHEWDSSPLKETNKSLLVSDDSGLVDSLTQEGESEICTETHATLSPSTRAHMGTMLLNDGLRKTDSFGFHIGHYAPKPKDVKKPGDVTLKHKNSTHQTAELSSDTSRDSGLHLPFQQDGPGANNGLDIGPCEDDPASLMPPPFSKREQTPQFHRQLSKRKSDTLDWPGRASDERDDSSESDDEDFCSTGHKSDPCTPTSPKTRKREKYDPYQIFEVQHTPCLILSVKVLRGRNITMGFQDYYDTPDPYINLVLRTSPEGKKSTTVKENCTSPEWDETFTFFINFTQPNILEISLMESNSLWFDQKVGTAYFDIVNMKMMDTPQVETFIFNQVSEVDIEFKLEFDRNPTLRYSLCLSDAEKDFISRRQLKVLEGLRKLLGDEECPLNIHEVPTIAVIGSGGGFRAMTGYSGVFKALVESGVIDCTTFAGGLSGSSWFISTLYSHPKWPNLEMDEFLEELKNSIDKSLLRFFNATTIYNYAKYMVQKRRDGQPVSFTDIFGRMVGETLLKDRMGATLKDQREKIKDGNVPMPLYTCVHVKKDVPAKSFQEWVEFSPYEIGMPKYGTFMDSELFGSKFFMGKLVKKYPEQPLHFLQGIWGSAFCILFRRLLEDNRRIDPIEMIRLEMTKKLEEERHESSSDPSDDDMDEEGDDSSSLESSMEDSDDKSLDTTDESSGGIELSRTDSHSAVALNKSLEENSGKAETSNGVDVTADADEAYEGEADEQEEMCVKSSIMKQKKLHIAKPVVKKCDVNLDASDGLKKTVNWGECPTRENASHEDKRKAYKRAGSSFKKSKSGSKTYWKKLMQGVFESNSWELLSTRRGRAAVIHNFMRGLSLQQTYPLSPFTPIDKRVNQGDEFDGIFEMHPTTVKHIYMVDAGLTFNSPYPLVLRPQRQVDIILSFDFSARPSDNHHPFKELLLAEKWARLNRLPFPPIDTSVFEREGMKELYIFRDEKDPHCPIVFHFVLVNKTFKQFKAPNVPRETQEELDFADFDVFDDPKAPYSTFNFTYTHKNFERLSQLMEFNTLLHIEDIKSVIKEVIKKKREGPPRVPIQSKDIQLLRMKSVQEMRKLKRFISKIESRASVYSTSTPPTPFYTPTPNCAPSSNPFFSAYRGNASPNALPNEHQKSVQHPVTKSGHFNRRREHCSSTSSEESVFGTPPQATDFSKHMASLFHPDTRNDNLPAFDTCDGAPTDDSSVHQLVSSSHSQAGRVYSKNTPSPLTMPTGTYNPDLSSTTDSTPSTGQFSAKIKTRKESPPNPFFKNAHFMRSCCNSISSSSSSSSSPYYASIESERNYHSLKRKPRKHKQAINDSMDDLPREMDRVDTITEMNDSTEDLLRDGEKVYDSISSQDSMEEFSMAAEAFKADGTPVIDPRQAKMFYESVKEKRKLLRRQSTVSSLNSISLDESGPVQDSCMAGDTSNTILLDKLCDGQASSDKYGIDFVDLIQFNGTEDTM